MLLVYVRCMSRTNIDIDDEACAKVMRRYRLATKREAANLALRNPRGGTAWRRRSPCAARVRLGGRPRRAALRPHDVILVDTSAWIEFLRNTGSSTCNRVDALLESEIATCDAVRMEVLAGARDERHLGSLRGLLACAVVIPTGPADCDAAAGPLPSLSSPRRNHP